MKNTYLVISISTVVCFLLYIIQEYTSTSYLVDSLIKIGAFFGSYFLFVKLTKKHMIPYNKINQNELIRSIFLGIASAGVIFVAFLFFKEYIDFSSIIFDLKTSQLMSYQVYFAGVYIILINSFIEEFYFRGFIFLNITNRKLAHIFSAFLFSVYHVAIFNTWFSSQTILIALIGLFAVSLFFNWVNNKSQSMYPSWIIHIIADISIMLIALYIFLPII